MVKTKPVEIVKKKWEARASIATPDYEFGVKNPRRDWAEAATAAEETWEAAIQEAIRDKRFAGGVKAVGTEKWQKKALEVGKDRYAPGVRAAVDDYSKAMSEVLSVIEGVTLPPKGPRGDPKNYERVKAIGDALHKYAIAKKKG